MKDNGSLSIEDAVVLFRRMAEKFIGKPGYHGQLTLKIRDGRLYAVERVETFQSKEQLGAF